MHTCLIISVGQKSLCYPKKKKEVLNFFSGGQVEVQAVEEQIILQVYTAGQLSTQVCGWTAGLCPSPINGLSRLTRPKVAWGIKVGGATASTEPCSNLDECPWSFFCMRVTHSLSHWSYTAIAALATCPGPPAMAWKLFVWSYWLLWLLRRKQRQGSVRRRHLSFQGSRAGGPK